MRITPIEKITKANFYLYYNFRIEKNISITIIIKKNFFVLLLWGLISNPVLGIEVETVLSFLFTATGSTIFEEGNVLDTGKMLPIHQL